MSDLHELLYVTGNPNKAREASSILGFAVKTPEKEIIAPEIQLESEHWTQVQLENYLVASNYVASRKAVDAEIAYSQSALVEDIAFYIPALEGRPGTDIKAWCTEKLMMFFCKEAWNYGDTRAIAICTLAISINGKVQLRHGRVNGTLPKKPIGNQEGAFGWDKIFCPGDSKLTYAQDVSQKQNSPRALALKELKENPFLL